MMHLMFQCALVNVLWKFVIIFAQFCLFNVTGALDWSPKARFLGRVHECSNHLINFLVLACKQYIYAKKCLNQKINVREFFDIFEKIHLTEKYNAKAQNKLAYHKRKWSPYTGEHMEKTIEKTSMQTESTESLAMYYLMDHGVT